MIRTCPIEATVVVLSGFRATPRLPASLHTSCTDGGGIQSVLEPAPGEQQKMTEDGELCN